MEDAFEVNLLIEGIRNRPIIWNIPLKEYHDKNKRQAAWREILIELFPNYDGLDETVMDQLGVQLSKKWKNIRDNYVKYLKELKKPGSRAQFRRYMYANQLTFLDAVVLTQSRLDDDGDSAKNDELADDEQNLTSAVYSRKRSFSTTLEPEAPAPSTSLEFPAPSASTEVVAPRTSTEAAAPRTSTEAAAPSTSSPFLVHNGTQKIAAKRKSRIGISIKGPPTSKVRLAPDEDRSFFESLLPAIKQFNLDQKLEFRSSVLEVLQNMRSSRRGLGVSSTTSENGLLENDSVGTLQSECRFPFVGTAWPYFPYQYPYFNAFQAYPSTRLAFQNSPSFARDSLSPEIAGNEKRRDFTKKGKKV